MDDAHETDKNIEMWKIKKLIKALETARGNGTSMISLIMPPRDQIARVTKMLGDEFGTASNIKSSVNRQSVLVACSHIFQSLKPQISATLLATPEPANFIQKTGLACCPHTSPCLASGDNT